MFSHHKHASHDRPNQAGGPNAAAKAARILHVLQRHPHGLLAQGVAARCHDIKPTAVYHYLASLVVEGALYQQPDGRYRLDPDYLTGAAHTTVDDAAVNIALQHFANATGHDAVIATIRDDYLQVTHAVGGPKSPDTEDMIEGFEESLHASAHGHALMAMAPPGSLKRYLHSHRLRRFTPNTVTEADAIAARLEASNETGIYAEIANYRTGVACLSAIIHNGAEKFAFATSAFLDDFEAAFPVLQEELSRTVVRLQPRFADTDR